MKIYTKTGDEGTSSLYSGARRQKDDAIFHALGDVDELNSAVGISRDLLADLDPKTAEQVQACPVEGTNDSRRIMALAALYLKLMTQRMWVLVRLPLNAHGDTAQLEIIQSRLLDVGSAVATPIEATGPGTATKQQRVQFDAAASSALETWIDEMDQELPQLTSFILPSGTSVAAADSKFTFVTVPHCSLPYPGGFI
jgi:cob(I)alamin adenosyltransferase